MRSQRIAYEMRYLANALQKYYPEYRSKYIIFAALGAIAGMFKFCQLAHFCSNRCHIPSKDEIPYSNQRERASIVRLCSVVFASAVTFALFSFCNHRLCDCTLRIR